MEIIKFKKPLLMLQSIKRAWRLDASHEHLHDCLLRFRSFLDEKHDTLPPSVAAVIETETQPMYRGRSSHTMAEQFVSSAPRSQRAALWGARALRRARTEHTTRALTLATRLDLPALSIQGCVEVLESLKDGDFGPCEKEIEQYVEACRAKFPYAVAFKPVSDVQEDAALQPKEVLVDNLD